MKSKNINKAICTVTVAPGVRFPAVGDKIPATSEMTGIDYEVTITDIRSVEWGEGGCVTVVVRGHKAERVEEPEPPGGYNFFCGDCKAYVGAAINPITGGPETLCYACAEEREHKRKREEDRQWRYTAGDFICVTGDQRPGMLRAIEWPDHDFVQWGAYRKCSRCDATQIRVGSAVLVRSEG